MIRCALPDNDVGYTIITTTRISDVAEQAGGAYNLKPLSLNNSRKLLYRRIFGSEIKYNNEDTEKYPDEALAEVSEKILNKCAGVPLAVITMVSALCTLVPAKFYSFICSTVMSVAVTDINNIGRPCRSGRNRTQGHSGDTPRA